MDAYVKPEELADAVAAQLARLVQSLGNDPPDPGRREPVAGSRS
jgi:hypothetical protein